MLSVLDLFRIGIGPSSSHTLGPIRIGKRYLEDLKGAVELDAVAKVVVELQGSLALTGKGHATPKAVVLGLFGLDPETLDPDVAEATVERVAVEKRVKLLGSHEIAFDPESDIVFAYHILPELHPNGMKLSAFGEGGLLLFEQTYYSTGGGFIATEKQLRTPAPKDIITTGRKVPFPFGSAAELLEHCAREGKTIEEIIYANEDAMRPREETDARLDRVAQVMSACIDRGLHKEGILPGALQVTRRAPAIWQKLKDQPGANEPERLFDWLNVYAMAVNEENAAGGQVVTAPTNGAAGILPSILRHYCLQRKPNARCVFLVTVGGMASTTPLRFPAEVGCQGEVGVACSMAAGALAEVMGGTPAQVENAAEIGMEHHLGLTCDPVGGWCRPPSNAMRSVL
jgi:L-serine dehydratase